MTVRLVLNSWQLVHNRRAAWALHNTVWYDCTNSSASKHTEQIRRNRQQLWKQ